MKKIFVSDLMQKKYFYFLTEPEGKNFDPRFKPELSPKEMLELGVFGGKYMTDCRDEFPKEWFKKAKLCHEYHDQKLNFFKINASQPLSVWNKKGWIKKDGLTQMILEVGFNGIADISLVEDMKMMKDK
jgi:hypothetical protein